jgi:hypothetical protein
MKLRSLCHEWAPVAAAAGMLAVVFVLGPVREDAPPRAVRPAAPPPTPKAWPRPAPLPPATPPAPPPHTTPVKPPPDAVAIETRPAALPPSPRVPPSDPWEYNYAAQAHGAVATGGQRPELLIDGNSAVYDGGSGFANTNWNAKPSESFVIRFQEGVRLNAARFLLWDKDSRFYRYKLEASPAMARDEWVLLADRTGETNECRSWQVVTFKTQLVCRLRLTGTYNSANHGFHVVEFEAYHIPPGLALPWGALEF